MKLFLVSFVLFYLKTFAKFSLWINKPYIIGIAGSVGKSSTKKAILAMLKDYKRTVALEGNSETGIPLSILNLNMQGFTPRDWLKALIKAPFGIFALNNVEILVVEMGIDDPFPPKNMGYLLSILKPNLSIDLNASATHTQQFEKLLTEKIRNKSEYLLFQIALEDSRIIRDAKPEIGIFNKDDAALDKALKDQQNLLTFGSNDSNAIYYGGYDVNLERTKFKFHVNLPEFRGQLVLYFKNMILPLAYQETLAAVVLTGIKLDINTTQIKESLEKNFKLPRGRATVLRGIKNTTIIDSSYNSSKKSLITFIELLKKLKKESKRPVIAVVGDMRELGLEAEKEHREAAEQLKNIADKVFLVGPLTHEFMLDIINEKKKKALWYKNSAQLGLHLKEELVEKAIVLVKGSQNEIFLEEAIKFILENAQDSKLLVRQSDFWMNIKSNHFKVSA